MGQRSAYGALVGVGTAVCGASAALATACVLPDYKDKKADVVFVVVALNGFATAAMVLYPPLCLFLGLDQREAGIMLGATIHDVAQVVGSAYPVSDAVGNTAVIVKLFRVFMLFPIVLAVGWWFARETVYSSAKKIPFPVFALVFVVLAVVNSFAPMLPAVAPAYALLKVNALGASSTALLVAIAALGLSTSFASITALGWRHLATVAATTIVILILPIAGLLLLP
jgi:uncharacterized integral membrane protein (TIGR00698 family)